MNRTEFENIARNLIGTKPLLYEDKLTNEQMLEKLAVLENYVDRIVRASYEPNDFEVDSMLLKLDIEARKLQENIRLAVSKK